jgi:hypothetical protein
MLVSGGYSRFPILPTFDAAQFDLLAGGWHSRIGYHSHNFYLNGSAYFTHYSDGNNAEREFGELMKWFGSGAFSTGAGYTVRHIHFQQQLANGSAPASSCSAMSFTSAAGNWTSIIRISIWRRPAARSTRT